MSSIPSDVPFDPTQPDPDAQTPTLSMLLESAIKESARRVRVCLPVRVTRVRGNQLVDLQPLLQVHYFAQAKPTTLPVIPNCPVSAPMGADFSIKLPIQVGDVGMALFCDRSLDAWMAGSGDVADPADVRTHDLTDGIYVPGLPSGVGGQTTDTTDDFVISNGSAQIRLEKNGTFRIKNNGQELVDLVGQLTKAVATLTQTLQAAMVSTLQGPQPFLGFTQSQLSQGLQTVNTIAQNLSTLQGK